MYWSECAVCWGVSVRYVVVWFGAGRSRSVVFPAVRLAAHVINTSPRRDQHLGQRRLSEKKRKEGRKEKRQKTAEYPSSGLEEEEKGDNEREGIKTSGCKRALEHRCFARVAVVVAERSRWDVFLSRELRPLACSRAV
ncbi:hypothetical protein MHYP_G00084000 [Metynnis hypsauchen]